METVGALRLRTYGSAGPTIIVLHGGPAAVGGAAGLASGLSGPFRVLEPWQRGSGPEPLTVARHVEDLHVLVQTLPPAQRAAIVGESWGAMLALAYAAAYPQGAAAIGLVGCGTFDVAARAKLTAALAERRSSRRPYDYAPLGPRYEDDLPEPFDEAAYTQTWDDMVRLQRQGVYPRAFAVIQSPLLMIHGDHDPHPGTMIRDSLRPHLPQLEYRELERCGHSPWNERFARDEFFAILKSWLLARLSDEA
jgi:pimeloyl-ACP methyl ester carboxylesterase